MRGSPRRLLATAAVAVALAAFSTPEDAVAQARTVAIDIPAQDLGPALRALARASGEQVIFQGAAVRGRRSNALSGTYAVDDALRLMLQGSGLSASRSRRGILVVSPATESSAPGEIEAGGAAADEAGADQEIIVTGTHLRGVSPTSPVVSVAREEIERFGYTNVQDVMARIPQNFSGVTPATGTGSGNVGLTTQVDIRGLGPQATLTLVNGRRVAGAAGNSGRAFDISMIPTSAIERIDILTDGASAIYGSDAVGGVVNMVLRRDYEGAETTIQYGLGDRDRERILISQLLGARWSSGRAMAAFQYERSDALESASIGLDTLDFRGRGGGDFRTLGVGSPGTVYGIGFFQGRPFTLLTGPGGAPVFSATLPAGDGRNVQLGQLGLNQRSTFDPVPVDVLPSAKNIAFYLTIEQEIGPVTLFGDFNYARRSGRQRITPNVNFFPVSPSNAFSPFDEPVLVGYALTEFGPITARPRSEGWFANVGARGRFGPAWSWEIVGSLSRDDFSTRVSSINSAELVRRLGLADPAQAFNPFGDGSGQSPGVIDAIRAEFSFGGASDMEGVAAQVAGELTALPGGPLRLLLGGEYRGERVETFVNQPGGVVQVTIPSESRNLQAAYAELYAPLVSSVNARPGFAELALSAAARWEHYSDFGDTFNPKLGLLWRPTRELLLRASWGTSFRAPGLRELFGVTRAFPNLAVLDPNAPGGPRTVFVSLITGGNPGLEPEEAETFSASAVYEPRWLPGARIGANYFHTVYRDRIRGSGDGLNESFLLSIEDQLPPGIIVRAADGTLQSVNLININAATTRISGMDLEGGYRWTGSWGDFNLNALATIFFGYDERIIQGAPVLELAGLVGNPADWRARAGLSWSRGDWGASVGVNLVGALENVAPDARIVRREVDSQATVDVQLSFSPQRQDLPLLRGLTVRVGANNLFDARPPFVDGTIGYDPRNHILEGRTVYLRVTKAFGPGA